MLTSGDFNAAGALRWFGPKHPELDFRALAAERRASLGPADRRWLKDRLTRMAMADGFEKDDGRNAIWLAETGRLLMQEPVIPGDILATAIDEAVKASARGFMPKVGQIRAIADPLAAARVQETVRLEAMARFLGAPTRDEAASDRPAGDWYSPQAAADIYAEVGYKPDASPGRVKPNDGKPIGTMADAQREIAEALGNPASPDGLPPCADIRGLTPTQIFEQRDRIRARSMIAMHHADMGGDDGR